MGHSPNQNAQALTVSQTGAVGGACLFTTAAPHTLRKNQPVILSGTTAPTGFTLGTTYYVVPDGNLTDTTFSLSATPSGPPIVASSAGTSVSVAMPTGTYRVIRIGRFVEEQWLTGQASAAAAKAFARSYAQGNQNQNWVRRQVYEFKAGATYGNEDVYEYVVSAADDGT